MNEIIKRREFTVSRINNLRSKLQETERLVSANVLVFTQQALSGVGRRALIATWICLSLGRV